MRSLSMLVAAALVAAVVVWWCWSGDWLPSTAGGSPGPAPAPVASAAGGAGAASPTAQRLAVDGVVDAAAGIAADAAAAGDATLTTITVVDGETGEPIAGTEVLWMDAASSRAMRQSLGSTLWWRDPELAAALGELDQEAARFGHRTRSDTDGRVQLQLGEYATLLGRHGDRYGQLVVATALSPPAEGYRLVLEPDLAITALVVDHAGVPVAGAPVLVSAENARGEGPRASEVLTDDAGLATRRHLQIARREFLESGRDGSGAQWRVRCSWSPGDDPGVGFAIDDLPRQPVRLQLPPGGRIRLTATLGGHPDAALAYAQLVEVGDDGASVGRHCAPGRRDADGWLRWRHVPLGKRFRVRAWSDELDRYAAFAGPTAPGEEVEVLLQPAAEAIVWCGRLLDPAQRPLANVRAMLRWSGPVESVGRGLETDGDGRFAVHLMDRSEDPQEHVVDFAQLHLDQLERVWASVELGACTLQPGVRDLGDLVLAPPPLLVRGHFAAAGRIVKLDAELRVECWRKSEDASDEGGPQWFEVPKLLTMSDEHGTFEVRGVCPPGPLRLRVTPRNSLPVEPVPFEVGATLVIDVQMAPALDVRVQTPVRDDLDQLGATLGSAALDPVTGGPSARRAQAFWLTGALRFYWPAVPPGTYSLLVHHQLAAAPLLCLDGVQVPLSDDEAARLQELDLREQLRVLRLRLLGPGGAPLDHDGAMVLLVEPAAPGEPWRSQLLWRPVVDLLMPAQLGGVLVACPGYRPARVPDGRDDVELQLEPWPTLLLTFPDLPAVPPGCQAKVRLRAVDEAGLGACMTRWGTRPVREFLRPSNHVAITAGRAEVAIGDGDHQVELVVEGPDAVLAVPRLQPGTVRAGAGPVAVSVPLDAWLETCREVRSAGR